jgi:hypothetical protein
VFTARYSLHDAAIAAIAITAIRSLLISAILLDSPIYLGPK